ncbi:MAG TPA: hypothetical protein ENJ79_06690, partial [Gammaproteobacteria bacterium]|nr:hypothetical protein [Gammaproteobacteria bacterium]
MNQDTRTEDYLAAWSLQRDPFDETHEAAFFYAGNALSQRLDLLTHLIQFGESVVVVSGPAGSGKTALLEQFAANIGPKCTLCLLNGADFDQLAPHLAEAVAGPVDADPTGLVEHWLRHADSTRQLVLAIDDADRLDDEACSRLCELVHRPGREQLRVLLFGAGEIQERVRRALDGLPEPHNSQLLEIPRLDEEETASYLMYRLAVAGYSGESPFTPTEVRAICKAADGRPGAINTLARQALIEHCQRLRGKKSRPAAAQGTGGIRRLALAGVVLFAAVLGYLGWRQFGASDHPSASAPLRPPGLPASTTHALPLPQPHAPDQDPSSASSTADGGRDRTGSGSEEYTEPAARRAAAGEENAGTSIQATATGIPDRA